MAIYNWTGKTGGTRASDAGNWNPVAAPAPSDSFIISNKAVVDFTSMGRLSGAIDINSSDVDIKNSVGGFFNLAPGILNTVLDSSTDATISSGANTVILNDVRSGSLDFTADGGTLVANMGSPADLFKIVR